MTRQLDLADIQGNILEPFVKTFPTARFVLLRIGDAAAGRQFILDYYPKVTTALRWGSSDIYVGKSLAVRPRVAINLALSYEGFCALGLPTRTLARMPPEFMDGMKKRAEILGDNVGRNATQFWDKAWRERAHILVGLNALMDYASRKPVPELEAESDFLRQLCAKHGLTILSGHGDDDQPWQDASARTMVQNDATFKPVPQEHFGFVDGISNPVFEGQFGDAHVEQIMAVGNGKILDNGEWEALATGEFLLGHPDEAQETAGTTMPPEIMRNGTFLVYRKLHENVASFESYIDRMAVSYAAIMNVPLGDARDILKAKMAGRWPDGIPLAAAPTIAAWRDFQAKFKTAPSDPDTVSRLVDFKYGDDPEGIKCPVTSHTRRTNTRDGLVAGAKSSALNNRRRILRRGLPYGVSDTPDQKADEREHGIVFLAMCASLPRQFEFVQQQWLNYGLDANAGNDSCPLVGNRSTDPKFRGDAKFLIPADPQSGDAPFICSNIPQFVEVKGGDYFFLPSMTALRMIGMGIVDPT